MTPKYWMHDLIGYAVLGILGFIISSLIGSCMARAQTIGGYVDGHAENHDYYKNWMQPGIFPPVSCCHVRQVYGSTIAGDCYPTEFELTSKGWRAKLRPEDQIRMGQIWIEIPDSKRVRQLNPDETGRDGHLCLSPSTNQVLCWIPPTGAL